MMLGAGLHLRTMFLARYLGKSPNVTQKSPQVVGNGIGKSSKIRVRNGSVPSCFADISAECRHVP